MFNKDDLNHVFCELSSKMAFSTANAIYIEYPLVVSCANVSSGSVSRPPSMHVIRSIVIQSVHRR